MINKQMRTRAVRDLAAALPEHDAHTPALTSSYERGSGYVIRWPTMARDEEVTTDVGR